MEKRVLLAFTLSFLVFALYLRFFAPQPPDGHPQPLADAAATRTAPAPVSTEPGVEDRVAPPPPPRLDAPVADALGDDRVREIRVDTPLFDARFTNRGARLVSFVLKHYGDSHGSPLEMVPMQASEQLGVLPLDLVVDEAEEGAFTERLKTALFQVSDTEILLGEGEEGAVTFRWSDGQEWEVDKTLSFVADTYELGVHISVRNGGREVAKRVLYGPGVGEESASGVYASPDQGVIAAAGQVQQFDADDIEDGQAAGVSVRAVGVSSHYFVALMLPDDVGSLGARLSARALELEGRERHFITGSLELPAKPASFRLFVGPKDHELLAALGPGLEYVIDYGKWMRYLVLPLRAALLWINAFVGNYGWSIVLLTVAINVLLFPLKHHSYVSMRKMQKLAPQIKRIQERYKKLKPTDPRRQEMNKEVYGLYREHNVSPLSGCLPMLLMIPFFFAFYQLLRVMIELRHAPWVFWIDDLSAFDPYFVLPILMGVTQIAMQRMTPQTTADPIQAKVMMAMPVVFIVILAWAPAGLVLYWFVNNLVSIGQQSLTNRLQSAEPEPARKGRKKSGKAARERGSA